MAKAFVVCRTILKYQTIELSKTTNSMARG